MIQGDGQGCLSGEFVSIPLRYDDESGILTIGEAKGSMPENCDIQVHFVHPDGSQKASTVPYAGKQIRADCPTTPAEPRMLTDEP